jgi:glycosyltransferase involved in cell wall biosynthesis
MKIAYLGSKGLPSKSGTERVVEAIVTRLSGKHEITVYCDARYTPQETNMDGIHLIRIPTIKGKHIQATYLFFISAIHALFCRYDLIHLHGTDACFMLPVLRLRYKVVTTAHGVPGRLKRLKWGKTARFFIRSMEYPFIYLSNYATSVSQPDADYLKARYRRNAIYIPNGVDDPVRFDLERARVELNQLGREPGKYLLFAAGRIDPTKGCHLLLEALNLLENPCKLIVVGDLNQVPSYGDYLKEIADEKQVVFLPPIADKELLLGIVKQANFFVFPSTDEGMSMMLLEAASLQTPVICSDIPENRAAMKDNVLYFCSGNVVDLVNKIQWALEHPKEMMCLGNNASAHVKANLTWEKIAAQYEEIYMACKK